MKRIISLILCLTMLFSLSLVVDVSAQKFTDVSPDSWYYGDVMNAVNLGLINGKTETTYCPDNNLTYAEAFKLAACMHQLATQGAVSLKNGKDQWYSTYVEYCFENGIYDVFMLEITDEEIDPTANITRSMYMNLFSKALPTEMLPIINFVPYGAIPDVPVDAIYTEGVYKLYRAGVLQGSDAKHSCKPFDFIRRSEVAAILTRMMDITKRIRFDMGTPVEYKPLEIEKQPVSSVFKSDEIPTASVSVMGGVPPYIYSWQFFQEGIWLDIGLLAKFEPEIVTILKGYDTDTVKSSSAINTTEDIDILVRCNVKDTIGNSVLTNEAAITIKGKDNTETEIPAKPDNNTTGDKGAQYYFDNADESRGENPVSPIKVSVSGTEFRFLKGEHITVKVEATGGTIAPENKYHTYRWYRYDETDGKWNFYTGGTYHPTNGYNPSLNFYESLIEVPGEIFKFKCVVKDQEGYTGESEVVTITTSDFTLEQGLSESIDVVVGEQVELSVGVKGGKEPYNYEWYIAEFVVPTKTYTKHPMGNLKGEAVKFTMLPEYLPKSDNVIKSFGCTITDAEGSEVDTTSMIVDKTPKSLPLTVVGQPKRLTASPGYGSLLQFDISVHGGTEPYSYEWFYDERSRRDVVSVSLESIKQTVDTQIKMFGSTLSVKLHEANPVIGKDIYCVVTDAKGNTVKSEAVAVCPDFIIIELEQKIEIKDIGTQYVGTVKCGTLVPGDRIGFIGSFDGKEEYVSGTVEKIEMFGKTMDKAVTGDRVGILLKNIKSYENKDSMKEIIGDPEYRSTKNLAFRVLPTVLTAKHNKNAYYTTPGKYTHLTVYITGGTEDYVSCEWFKEVDGKWVSFDKQRRTGYSESKKCFYIQGIYYGEKEYASYRAKCIVTDSAGNKAESDIVTLTTSDIGFENELPAETKVSDGETLTLTVKPKGGKAPYKYKWFIYTVNVKDSYSRIGYLENDKSCTGYDTDTVTFKVDSSYISVNLERYNEIRRSIGCQITDANGATVSVSTLIVGK